MKVVVVRIEKWRGKRCKEYGCEGKDIVGIVMKYREEGVGIDCMIWGGREKVVRMKKKGMGGKGREKWGRREEEWVRSREEKVGRSRERERERGVEIWRLY